MKKYQKPKMVAKNAPTGSYAAGCPALYSPHTGIGTPRCKDFPKCLTCEARDYCAMCLVRNYNESGGDMFKTNQHFCDVAFLNKRLVEEWKEKKNTKFHI